MSEREFVYDEDQSRERNFGRWYEMNCDERSGYNEKSYTREEGEAVFEDFVKRVT